ncbi:MAG: hypothetical protein ACRC8A_19630 [Microcoleaceae cyanobacterium]
MQTLSQQSVALRVQLHREAMVRWQDNVPAERLQTTFATSPRSLDSPLQPGC